MAGSPKKPSKEEVKAMIKFKKEKKKLDDLLKKGKISQGAYQRRLQKIAPKGAQMPGMQMAPVGGIAPPMAPMPGGPPQPMPPGQQPVPQVPITPSAHEEIPQVGKPLAISSDDIEVVECHQCSGLITVTAPQRPVIVECPACGAKGEVEKVEEDQAAAPVPVSATEAEFASPTFYLGADKDVEKPKFGESLKTEEETPQPEVEAPSVEKEEPVVVEHDRKATVEYDESMYDTKAPSSYEHDDGTSSTIMDFGEAKTEGDEEPETPEPKVEVKTPTVAPTPTVSVKLKLKPKVKNDD